MRTYFTILPWLAVSVMAARLPAAEPAVPPSLPVPTVHFVADGVSLADGVGGNAVVALPLDDLFRRPIGPRGLEYSESAKAKAGRRVRLVGYMVRQTAPVPFCLLLTPQPIQLHEREYGLADDLPANTVHVHFAKGPMPVIPHVRGAIIVEGVLELGPVEEADGRLSHVRLRCAAPWQGHARPPRPAETDPSVAVRIQP